MDPKHPADPTVGEIRWLGAQTVIVGCRECSYQQVANIAKLPDSVPLRRIAAQFVCPRCQNTGAYVLPKMGRGAKSRVKGIHNCGGEADCGSGFFAAVHRAIGIEGRSRRAGHGGTVARRAGTRELHLEDNGTRAYRPMRIRHPFESLGH